MLLIEVAAGSPAGKAGLQAGDVVTALIFSFVWDTALSSGSRLLMETGN